MAKAKEWLARKPKALDAEQGRLLQDVLDHPDDDHARLVYADWLMERKDPRGEFISISIELETAKGDREKTIAARKEQLEQEHGDRWLQEIGWPEKSLGVPRFEKGFITKMGVLAQVLVPIMDSVFSREPVRKLEIRSVKPASLLDEILANPKLQRVEEIDFWGSNSFSATQAKKIASSPNLSGLKRLSLFATALGPKGVQAFFDSVALPRLEHLHLGDNGLDSEGVKIVAAAKRLPATLDLSKNKIGAEGARALAESPALAGVQALVLNGCHIGDEGLRSLARSPHAASLRTLRMKYCDLGPKGMEALADSTSLAKVTVLDLEGNEIKAEGLKTLASMKLEALLVDEIEGTKPPALPAPERITSYGFHS
jgi:uncharacterized protein (TIGR02996 family)